MEVEFNFAGNRAKFEMAIEYEADDLQFSSRNHDTPDNIAHILRRYAAIDRINKVSLRGITPLCFRYVDIWKNILLQEHLLVSQWTPPNQKHKTIEFNLNADIYLYNSGSVLLWYPDQELPYWLRSVMDVHYAAVRPVLIGTVEHYLSEMKTQAKSVVKANATSRANIMRANADKILDFLGEK